MQMTEKQPNESAMIAPMTGRRLVQPLTMFTICVAAMLSTWNFSIKYTTKFVPHPDTASVNPASDPVFFILQIKTKAHNVDMK